MATGSEMEAASRRMVEGFREFAGGLVEMAALAAREMAKAFEGIDWAAMARLKAADPDAFNWMASGPVRRVQLRRARAMMAEGRRRRWDGR